MKTKLKIFFAILFVVVIGIVVARSFLHESPFEAVRRYRAAQVKHEAVPVQQPRPPAPRPQVGPSVAVPQMAIILDDWGNSYAVLAYALEIQRPLTLSVIPRLPQSRRIAEEAHAKGLGVMLHMPMQPKRKEAPLEPHTILVTSTDDDIRRYLDEALASVPYVEGVNNHMGSAATSDARVMRTFLGYLKTKNVFFIDSMVTDETQGPSIARNLHIPFTKRDVFIDNAPKPEAIRQQLLYAVTLAKKRGRVIVIGHDRKVTLETIRKTLPEIEKQGVKLVLAKELVYDHSGN